MANKYYYLVMTQQDFTENQVIEEILRERMYYYINRKDQVDFWVIMSPLFLSSGNLPDKLIKTNFYTQKQKDLEENKKIYTAVVMTPDYNYICWLKLRLGYFEDINGDQTINESFKSDGLCGILEETDPGFLTPFETIPNELHPNVVFKKFQRALITYYNAH